VALLGQTPVRITGAVNKGDRVFVCDNGTASVSGTGSMVGIALETDSRLEEKNINCFIKV